MSNPPLDRSTQITAWRIRFVSEAPGVSTAYRRYADPSPTIAVRESVNEDLSSPAAWPPGDSLQIVCISDSKGLGQKIQSWTARAEKPDAVAAVAVTTETLKLRWLPGRAVIIGSTEDCEETMAAVVDFSFYEGELRRLEQDILQYQSPAKIDVPLAYEINPRDESQWDRLYRTMEDLYQLRLRFARLEPHLYQADRTLSADSRRVIARLANRSDIEARLEALNDRMETIEDLYEGATDRITDYRNYRNGFRLEIAIVVLLVLEVVLLVIQAFE